MNLYTILLSVLLIISSLDATDVEQLCFTSSLSSTLCAKEQNSTIFIESKRIDEQIYIMQTVVRATIDENIKRNQNKKLILISEGFMGTLLAVAQANLLPYYKKHIHGLVLKKSVANYYEVCHLQKSLEDNQSCLLIQAFEEELSEIASREEVLKALSPALQMDWYEKKIVLIGLDKEERFSWKKALDNANIDHIFLADEKLLDLKKQLPLKLMCKVEPKELEVNVPNFYGAIVRFHLFKFLYRAKENLTVKRNIKYGKDENQSYDVFYKKESRNNKLIVYLHGGGWESGDKKLFEGMAKQYADKGYTVAILNYRLLDLPLVDMRTMVLDTTLALRDVMENAHKYKADKNHTIVMADSFGALLAYMSMIKLSKEYRFKRAVFNSMPSDLSFFTGKKRFMLSGLKEKEKLNAWVKTFSPFHHLMDYAPKTLLIAGLDDKVVDAKHLEKLEIYSVINHNNISTLWVENAGHLIVPNGDAMHPSFQEIELKIDNFIQ